MTYALVLGAGGVTGIAWETGLLKGLRDAGLDLTTADLVIGTSAGSVVGTQVTTGVPLDELYRRQVEPPRVPVDRPPDLGKLMEFFANRSESGEAPGARRRPTREMMAWIGRQARATSTKVTEAGRLEVIKSRLPVHEWPERRLIVTAVDTADGVFITWQRSSGVPLPLAVASSCAVPWVYPPATINGRRYMDGGVRSTTNADLAAGHDLVVIVAPIAGFGRATVDEEADELRRAGARVEVVVPAEAALEAIGPNPLDPARRVQAAKAGLDQAPSAAEELAGVRARLTG
jgi:NTE family protein